MQQRSDGDEQADRFAGIAPEVSSAIRARESRNLATIILHDVTFRVGWVFKTESVIMPAFLDAVAGAGWVRGLLPAVNRFGQSLPPALFAASLRRLAVKKYALAGCTFGMAAAFLLLAVVWWRLWQHSPPWMAALFLALYGLFAAGYGLYLLCYGTLQGKLIRMSRRGRLLAVSLPLGSIASITCALLLMGRWLAMGPIGFGYLFAMTGGMFALSGVVLLTVAEPRWQSPHVPSDHDRPLRGALHVLRHDANYRVLAVVAMLTAVAPLLFPHYQALARERLSLGGSSLMAFVVVQNAAVGIFGLLLGWLIDRRGHRLALRVALFIAAVAPLVALFVSHLDRAAAARLFWVTFLPLGMTPITLRVLIGYTLDASPIDRHPRYLSTLGICLALPFCLSPLVGWLVDLAGFDAVLGAGAALVAAGGLLTFRLAEPRRQQPALIESAAPPGG